MLMRLGAGVAALAARIGASPAMVRGAIWSIGGNTTGAAASFITQVILARALQATQYGVYSYLLAWVNVAVLVGKLEFDGIAVRFIGAYDGQRKDGLLRGFLLHGWRVVGSASTALALVAGSVVWLLRDHLRVETDWGIWAACVLVPLSAMLLFSGSILQGFRRVPQAQLPQQLLRPVLFGVALILVVHVLGIALRAAGAVALNAGAAAVALAVSLFFLKRAVPSSTKSAAPAFDSSMWMRTVRGFLVISGAQLVLSQQADILVVGTLLSARDAGLYSVASQLSSLITLGSGGVLFVVLPAIADLHARGRRMELQRLVVGTVQGCAAVSIPIAVPLIVASHFVLRLYGAAFVDAYPVLIVLSIAQLGGAMLGGLSGYLLTMTSHEWQASRVIVGTALLNLALTFVLTPTLGAVGAALATAGAGLTRLELLRRLVRRHVGVSVAPYLPTKPPLPERA